MQWSRALDIDVTQALTTARTGTMYTKAWMQFSAVCGVVAVLGGCGGGNGPVGNNGSGQFSAQIDGAAWSGANAIGAAGAGGIFTLTGVQLGSGTGLTMTLYSIGAPGTYPLGVAGNVAGGIATIVSNSTSFWSTPLNGAAGTVTISAVSPTRIAGTFNFTAPPVAPQTGAARVVTQGQFDIPVTGPATLVVPPNAASRITGTIAGSPFNAATVVSVTSLASGTLTFAGSTIDRTLNVIIAGYTGVGSYTLGTGAARTVRLSTAQAPVSAWGGTNATTSGTLVVTSASASRVAGTISATLQPAPGFTGAPITITATFDVGVQ
jgi:Family of unknown function (DUF6252)